MSGPQNACGTLLRPGSGRIGTGRDHDPCKGRRNGNGEGLDIQQNVCLISKTKAKYGKLIIQKEIWVHKHKKAPIKEAILFIYITNLCILFTTNRKYSGFNRYTVRSERTDRKIIIGRAWKKVKACACENNRERRRNDEEIWSNGTGRNFGIGDVDRLWKSRGGVIRP